ncbi:hypothetical protein CK503_12800 [Aliifodinibius salipaludis]|uniref:DUF4402 domain-containing protein n=1 Tax=Fodinibius salipaludis TaxID=2032627 RepID=A0A2A2G8W5_9BACT|nr:hypothetical protein [Aliifodinibius salipaludis]PAU93295.1 hypothetical protein CK503_12800 [Aliifodinibius salipaludis]
MNKNISTFFLLFVTLLLVPMGSLLAQQNENGTDVNINVSAQVISSIEMITINSMNLSEVEPENNRISINPQNSTNAGKMIAIGNPNSEIRISYLEQRELTQPQRSETLIFNYEVAGNTEDDQSSAKILDRENRDFEFNEDGRFYLWIGGNVDISTASPGNYQGEFTIDIEYI